MKVMSEKKIGYKDILHQKEYMKLLIAGIINRFGDAIDAVAFTWIVYEISGSAAWSALIFGMNKIPGIFFMPFAGAFVENIDKKKCMVITDVIRAGVVAFIATAYFAGGLTPWMVLVCTLIISTAEAFRLPASTAFTPRILEKKYYAYGMSLTSSISSIVEIIGTIAAAGIIGFIQVTGAIYVDMITFLLSALLISTIRVKNDMEAEKRRNTESYFQTLKEGFQYTVKNPIARFLIISMVYLNAVLVPINSLEAPMVSEIFRGGAEMLAVISVSLAIGALLGSFTFPFISEHLQGNKIVILSAFMIGIYYAGMVICQPLFKNEIFTYCYLILVTGLLGYIASLTMSYIGVETVKSIEERYLARTTAVMNAAAMASCPVLAFVISMLVSRFEVGEIFFATGILNIAVCIIFCGKKVAVAKMKKNPVNEDVGCVRNE